MEIFVILGVTTKAFTALLIERHPYSPDSNLIENSEKHKEIFRSKTNKDIKSLKEDI